MIGGEWLRGSPVIDASRFTWAIVVLFAMSGCTGTPSIEVSEDTSTGDFQPERSDTPTSPSPTDTSTETADPVETDVGTMTNHPSLESVLFRLATAENPTVFAAEHGLKVKDGRVQVVIELEANATVPTGYDIEVTSRFETQVQAYVAFADLIPLAESEGVRIVRTPTEVQPHNEFTDPR